MLPIFVQLMSAAADAGSRASAVSGMWRLTDEASEDVLLAAAAAGALPALVRCLASPNLATSVGALIALQNLAGAAQRAARLQWLPVRGQRCGR